MITMIFLLAVDYSFLPVIEDTIIIQKWHYLGPFSVGMREGIIGINDEIELDPEYMPDAIRRYPSILVPGGYVSWRSLDRKDDRIEINYPEVQWDTIQDYYGYSGIYCASYALADFESPGFRRALITAQGVSSFKLNGQLYHGDAYQDGFMPIPVVLNPGNNRILIKTAGFGDHNFTFRIVPASAPLMIIDRDVTTPDIVSGETAEFYIGVPLINTTDQTLNNIRVSAIVKGIGTGECIIKNLESQSAIKIPMMIKLANMPCQPGDSIPLNLNASFGDFITDADIWLKIKANGEAVNRSFISEIDKSCQYYSVLPPGNFDPESTYALIMTCHGAGVIAENQINSYMQKDWAFVVAPTNRRRYGFDWQDWGRLDFLEVLEDVRRHYKINENRIYLTGHSMGGHGVWHIAAMHPDLFAAIAPSAGWTNFQLYIPWFLQKSEIFAHPDLIKFRDIVLREDNPLIYLENLKNVPVYILHGGADDNVPPIQGRMFAKYLDVLGYKYIYNEVSGKGHWWDIDSTPGVDCVDLKELMDFLKSNVRDPLLMTNIKRSDVFGKSLKRAYFDPFILVYGTIGDTASTKNNLQQARYQSYAWWYRANGYVEIVSDMAVTNEIIKDYNLILFGNARTNSIISRINNKMPLKIKNGLIYYNRQEIDGADLCIVQVYSNPLNPGKLVCLYEPATKEAEKIMGFFTPLYSGAGLPDFIVFDRSVLKYGWAGVKSAGFFDHK